MAIMNSIMKGILIGTLLFLFIVDMGCTTISDSNQNIDSNSVILKDSGTSMVVTLDHIEVENPKPYLHVITIFLKATNNGDTAVQLVGYTKLTDYAGVSHKGSSISFGLLYPGESGIANTVFGIDSNKKYDALKKGATMSAWLLDGKKNTFDASWIIHLNNF